MLRTEAAKLSFPRACLLAIGGVSAMVIGVNGLAWLGGHSTQIPVSTPLAERSLRFEDRPDGGVAVRDADTGGVITVVTGQAGFLRPTILGLGQQRKRDDLSASAPLRLTRWADGRLTLDDPTTRFHIELEAFGVTNEAVFAQFLDTPEIPR